MGTNDHYANITDVEIFKENDIKFIKSCEVKRIDSLFLKSDFNIVDYDIGSLLDDDFDDDICWKYEEFLPVGLDIATNQYIKQPFVQTNMKVESKTDTNIYKVKNKVLQFI